MLSETTKTVLGIVLRSLFVTGVFAAGIFLEKSHAIPNGCPDWTQVVSMVSDGTREVPLCVTRVKIVQGGLGYVPTVGEIELFDQDGSRQAKLQNVQYLYRNGRWTAIK